VKKSKLVNIIHTWWPAAGKKLPKDVSMEADLVVVVRRGEGHIQQSWRTTQIQFWIHTLCIFSARQHIC